MGDCKIRGLVPTHYTKCLLQNNTGLLAFFCSAEARGGQGYFLSGPDFCTLLDPPACQQNPEETSARSE